MGYATTLVSTNEQIDTVGRMLRPGQQINVAKLAAQLGWTKDRLHPVKREMMRRGFLTEERRARMSATLTFHNPPLPESERQMPKMRHTAKATPETGARPWQCHTVKTWTITGGTFTAEELKSLARSVLKHLDEL